MKKLKVVWIDDNPKRERDANNLKQQLNIDVEFVSLKGQAIDKMLHDLMDRSEPNLVILDHSLDQAISETYKTGSTAAAYLHETWPECPIISFTGVNIDEVDLRHKSAYEGMYPINRISNHYNSIISIAEGFLKLKVKKPKNVDDLLSSLEVPDQDQEKMKKILPKEIKSDLDDKSFLPIFYRWCKSTLFQRPGFLYDELWAATYLGLTVEGFKKIEKSFDKAKYSGVFMNTSERLWWKSRLLEILGKLTQDVDLPWINGRQLVENKKYYSKCFASGEEYPETVAAEDGTSGTNWKAMKLKYTEPHPNYEDMLFFDQLRIMKPA